MIFTLFCCTFMNHCNPDSSTKTHILSYHLTQNMSCSITLLYRKLTFPLTQNMSSFTKDHMSSHQNMQFFKGSSTENTHIFPHKPLLSKTLPQNIHTSSHTKHVFSITLLYRKFIHPLTQNMSFYMPSITKVHISSHQTHAVVQWLCHSKFNSHIFPHKPCLLSKALPTQTMPCFKDSSA